MDYIELSVTIPCYNEEDSLYELYNRVTNACLSCCENGTYEVILVNDGSKDTTWSIITELSSADQHIVGINLSRNYGHQIALSAALQFARGSRIFILDADLQDPPELLPKMMAIMDDGIDVVYGQRISRDGETWFKKGTAYLFYRFLNFMTDVNIPNDTGDFRLISRRTADILNKMPEQYRFIRGMVSWIGLKQEAIPYERSARFAGTTKYPISKMFRLAADAITSFSIRPLRLASHAGLYLSLTTFIIMMYVFINYFTGHPLRGWTSLMVMILAMGSVQLLVLGVIGEYLGRLYMQTKGRPLFVVEDIVGRNNNGEKDIVGTIGKSNNQ
mgnify:CR=1 FL=1